LAGGGWRATSEACKSFVTAPEYSRWITRCGNRFPGAPPNACGLLPCISEEAMSLGQPAERPFVLLAQPSLFDPSRAPEGRHTAWAYCHIPNGSRVDML